MCVKQRRAQTFRRVPIPESIKILSKVTLCSSCMRRQVGRGEEGGVGQKNEQKDDSDDKSLTWLCSAICYMKSTRGNLLKVGYFCCCWVFLHFFVFSRNVLHDARYAPTKQPKTPRKFIDTAANFSHLLLPLLAHLAKFFFVCSLCTERNFPTVIVVE